MDSIWLVDASYFCLVLASFAWENVRLVNTTHLRYWRFPKIEGIPQNRFGSSWAPTGGSGGFRYFSTAICRHFSQADDWIFHSPDIISLWYKSGWWFQPIWKKIVNWGWLFLMYGKMKNVPNHQSEVLGWGFQVFEACPQVRRSNSSLNSCRLPLMGRPLSQSRPAWQTSGAAENRNAKYYEESRTL